MAMDIVLNTEESQKKIEALSGAILGLGDSATQATKKVKDNLDIHEVAAKEFKELKELFRSFAPTVKVWADAMERSVKPLQEVQAISKDIVTINKSVSEGYKAISSAIKDQTAAVTKAVKIKREEVSATGALASELDKENKLRSQAAKIIALSTTAAQKRAQTVSMLNKLENEGLITSTQRARAWEMMRKGINDTGTELERYLNTLKTSNREFAKQDEGLLKLRSGWKTLKDEQKQALLVQKQMADDIQLVGRYIKPQLSVLQEYQQKFEALQRLRDKFRSSRGLEGVNEEQYRTALANLNSELAKAAAQENNRKVAVSKSVQAELDGAKALRRRIDSLNELTSVYPKVTSQQAQLAAGFNRLTQAEQQQLITLTNLKRDMDLIGPVYQRSLPPIEKYRNTVLAAARANAAFITSGGAQGISAATMGVVRAGAFKELMSATVASHTLNRGLMGVVGGFNALNQVTAASRAALMGTGLSFGIFTSSTIAAAGAVYTLSKALSSSIKVGMEFEYAYTKVTTLMQGSFDAINQTAEARNNVNLAIKNEILRLAETTQFNALEVADAAIILARSGKDAAFIFSNLEAVLDLAAVGMLDMAKAADIATAVMASYNMGGREFTNAVDILAATATRTKATVEDIGNSVSYIGPIAAQAGVEFTQLSGAIGVLADVNIRGSRAGTSLRRIITNLLAPTTAGKKAFQELSISIEDLTRNGVDLAEIFTILRDRGAGIEELKAIFGQYAISAAAALTRSVDKLKDLERGFASATGYAAEMRDQLRDNLKLELEELGSVWQTLQVYAFDAFGPKIRDGIGAVTEYLRNNKTIVDLLANTVLGLAKAVEFLVKTFNIWFNLLKAFVLYKAAVGAINLLIKGYGLLVTAITASKAALISLKAAEVSSAFTGVGVAAAQTATKISLATKASTAFAATGNVLLRALGGIPGLIAGVAAGLLFFATSASQAAVSTEMLSGASHNVLAFADSLHDLSDAKLRVFETDLLLDSIANTKNLNTYSEEIAKVEEQLNDLIKIREDLLAFNLANGDIIDNSSIVRVNENIAEKEKLLLEYRNKYNKAVIESEDIVKAQGLIQDEVNKRARADLDGLFTQYANLDGQVKTFGDTLISKFQSVQSIIERVYNLVKNILNLVPGLGNGFSGLGSAFSGLNQNQEVRVEAGNLSQRLRALMPYPEAFDQQDEADAYRNTINNLIKDISANTPAAQRALESLNLSADEAINQLKTNLATVNVIAPTAERAGRDTLKDQVEELKKYFEEYDKGAASAQALAGRLSTIDDWMKQILAGTPAAARAMKEFGIDVDEAKAALNASVETNFLEYIGTTLEAIDPRFKDFEKSLTITEARLLSTDEAMALLSEALSDPAIAAAVAAFGGLEAIMNRFAPAVEHVTSGNKALTEQFIELQNEANKAIAAVSNTEALDDLAAKFERGAVATKNQAFELLSIQKVYSQFGSDLRSVRSEGELMDEMQRALEASAKKLGLTVADITRLMNQYEQSLPTGKLRAEAVDLRNRIDLLSRGSRAQFIYNRAVQDFGQHIDKLPEGYLEAANAAYNFHEELARAEELQAIWKRFGDSLLDVFTDVIAGIDRDFDSLKDRLKDTFKKLLKDLAYQALTAKIAVNVDMTGSGGGSGFWGSLLSSFFGGQGGQGGGGLGTLLSGAAAAYGVGGSGQGAAGPSTGDLISNYGFQGAGTGGGGGGNNYLGMASSVATRNYSNIIAAAANYVFGAGFSGGFAAGVGSVTNVYGAGAGSLGTAGSTSGFVAGQYAGYAGQALGAVGGAYMGYQMHRGQSTTTQVAAIASYAALGYAVSTVAMGAMAGAAAGTGAAAGAGAAAGGAFGAAGGAVAIPIIGWILGLMALVDFASGGRIFGTSFRPERVDTTVGIRDQESFSEINMQEWRYTHGFFRRPFDGLGDRISRQRNLDVPPEVQRMADNFYKVQIKAAQGAARAFRAEVGPIIDGTFTTRVAFTDKGRRAKDKDKSFATILGKTYDDITFEEFTKRMTGFQMLSQVANNMTAAMIGDGGYTWNYGDSGGSGGAGGVVRPERPGGGMKVMLEDVAAAIEDGSFAIEDASHNWDESFAAVMSIAMRWEDDADLFLAGAQFLVAAGADMVRGWGLLQGRTLAEITDVVESYQADGESLIQTYVRLKESVALVTASLTPFGLSLNRTAEDIFFFSADLVESLGGLDTARTLLENFARFFGDMTDLSGVRGQAQYQVRESEMQALGLAGDVTAQEFIEAFTEALSEGMTAFDTADWLVAAQRLIAIGDAIDQLRLQAGAAQETVATQVAQQIAAIESLGASELELAEAREYGNRIIRQALDDFMIGIENALQEFEGTSNPFIYQFRNIQRTLEANLETARQLGATELELYRIRQLAEYQTLSLIDKLRASIISLIQQFRGLNSVSDSQQSVISSSTNASNELYEAERRRYEMAQDAIKRIGDYLRDLEAGPLSPGDWKTRLSASRSTFDDLVARAMSGDMEAAGELTNYANELLSMGQDLFGSGLPYTDLYAYVTDALRGVQQYLGTIPEPPATGGGNEGGGTANSPTIVEETQSSRYQLALNIASQIGALGLALKADVFRLLEEFGMPLIELVEAMNIDIRALTTEGLYNLSLLAAALNVDLVTLIGEVGIQMAAVAEVFGLSAENLNQGINTGLLEFRDYLGVTIWDAIGLLGVNLADLALSLGLDINNLTEQSVPALISMAEFLGVLPTELISQLGMDLIDLGTAFGLIMDDVSYENFLNMQEFARLIGLDIFDLGTAFGLQVEDIAPNIATLLDESFSAIPDFPEDIAAQLAPFLEGIRTGNNPEAVRQAVASLYTFTQTLPAEYGSAMRQVMVDLGFGPDTGGPTTQYTIDDSVRELQDIKGLLHNNENGFLHSIDYRMSQLVDSMMNASSASLDTIEALADNKDAENQQLTEILAEALQKQAETDEKLEVLMQVLIETNSELSEDQKNIIKKLGDISANTKDKQTKTSKIK